VTLRWFFHLGLCSVPTSVYCFSCSSWCFIRFNVETSTTRPPYAEEFDLREERSLKSGDRALSLYWRDFTQARKDRPCDPDYRGTSFAGKFCQPLILSLRVVKCIQHQRPSYQNLPHRVTLPMHCTVIQPNSRSHLLARESKVTF
jgi:hypothetical protein